MKRMTVTEVARRFRSVLERVERDQEEIIVLRKGRPIARLIPEAPAQDALSVLGDLQPALDDDTAEVLQAGVQRMRRSKAGRIARLRNPLA